MENATRTTLSNVAGQAVHALNNTASQFAAHSTTVEAAGLPVAVEAMQAVTASEGAGPNKVKILSEYESNNSNIEGKFQEIKCVIPFC